MDKLVKTLGIDSLSKSQVSRMAADLDQIVEEFRHPPLDAAGPFTFVAADALTMKVREGGRVVNAVVLLATGVNGDGHREVLGMRVATSESGAAWNEFFADLLARGLAGVRLLFRRPCRTHGGDLRDPARRSGRGCGLFPVRAPAEPIKVSFISGTACSTVMYSIRSPHEMGHTQ